MEHLTVTQMMVPLADYAVVSEEATMFEAMEALEKAQRRFRRSEYKHRAVVVVDAGGQVIGKLSQSDVLKGLEPGYQSVTPLTGLSHWELSRETIQSMMTDYNLWGTGFKAVCRKAFQIKVKDIMYTPASGEYVGQDATLKEAIHQLVVGGHQSLLVVDGNQQLVGILRLTDVFHEAFEFIKTLNEQA